MKKLRKLIRPLISSILILYVGLILLLHTPFVQKGLGDWVADALSRKIGSEVKVGRVDLGFLNHIIIDDLEVKSPDGENILKAARTAVTIELPDILKGNINITTAQLFGVKARLYRKTQSSPLNIQYIIDAFAADEEEPSTPINLKVSSLILRHVDVTYDVLSERQKTDTLDVNHLHLSNIGLTASIRAFTEDSLNVSVRRLNFTEKHSGLTLKNLATSVAGNRHSATMDSLVLETPKSLVRIGTVNARYGQKEQLKLHSLTASLLPSFILPSEWKPLLPQLALLDFPLQLEGSIDADEHQLRIDNFNLNSDDHSIALATRARVLDWQEKKDVQADIQRLQFSSDGLSAVLAACGVDRATQQTMTQLGQLGLKGTVAKEGNTLTAKLDAMSDIGDVAVTGDYQLDDRHLLSAHVETQDFDLGTLIQNELLGHTAFSLDVDGEMADLEHLHGKIYGDISAFDYRGYTYHNIFVDGMAAAKSYEGILNIDDEHLKLSFNGSLTTHDDGMVAANMVMSVPLFEPHALHLTKDYEGEEFCFTAVAKAKGRSLATAVGEVVLDSIRISTPKQIYLPQAITLSSELLDDEQKKILVSSDFLNATFVGNINYSDIIPSFQNQLANHLPSLIPHTKTERKMDTAFDFEMELTETPLVHHFLHADYQLLTPARITGRLNASSNTSFVMIDVPSIEYEGTRYDNVKATYNGSSYNFKLNAELLRCLDEGDTHVSVNALAQNDVLTTHLSLDQMLDYPMQGNVSAKTFFSRQDGMLDTHIHVQPSELTFNDTTWLVKPADIRIYGKQIECHNLEVSSRDRFVKVNGIVSESPSDSLIVQLNNVEVDYVLALVDFTAVDFRGRAFGTAYVSNVYKQPKFLAALRVEDMAIGNGVLGLGNITAHWDDSVDGIRVNGHITDTDPEGLDRITDCTGYISPSDNKINLSITANNTNAYFLNDFLGGVFRDIHGSANGVLNVVGPLNDIGLVGDLCANVGMTLRATNVTYHVSPQDTIRFRPYCFGFENIHIHDDDGNQGTVNGFVSHHNVKDFAYEFHINMQHLLAYREDQFNSDKFMGLIYASGTMDVRGADGSPLNITADVTPTRGSFFAYDAATPDAITSSTFLTFHDAAERPDTLHTADADDYEYEGDIFMNVAIHLNPDCAIKLRMDNADDGYITTYGTGRLHASYYNKGAFTLAGIYNIQNGNYRLYLQDIIYRDLVLQDGSSVVFNGNPFDANLHLICHHTINSVPLTDLTAGMTTTGSNKIKVVCILDITGQLGNMNFRFDLNLPNVNDEVRQLVRSYITTEEDMNMQMIYLLGLGRFYTNEYARQGSNTGGGGAVNTLLSSTISGQINQMLSNVIPADSKWNFGTGLTTGEQGWNDLDVEGMLSGRLLDDRLLINGNFGYRDNTLTQNSTFIGDFDVKWRIREGGNTYLKAYNKTNDRYFTKATLNTQGVGISYQRDFEHWRDLFRKVTSK